jgi:hypothetical protein
MAELCKKGLKDSEGGVYSLLSLTSKTMKDASKVVYACNLN